MGHPSHTCSSALKMRSSNMENTAFTWELVWTASMAAWTQCNKACNHLQSISRGYSLNLLETKNRNRPFHLKHAAQLWKCVQSTWETLCLATNMGGPVSPHGLGSLKEKCNQVETIKWAIHFYYFLQDQREEWFARAREQFFVGPKAEISETLPAATPFVCVPLASPTRLARNGTTRKWKKA